MRLSLPKILSDLYDLNFFLSNQIRIILAALAELFSLNQLTNCAEPMLEDTQNMTMEELVDILAQKTQKYTQLLVYKDFGTEYKECKEAIQHILAEIDLRKEAAISGRNEATSST